MVLNLKAGSFHLKFKSDNGINPDMLFEIANDHHLEIIESEITTKGHLAKKDAEIALEISNLQEPYSTKVCKECHEERSIFQRRGSNPYLLLKSSELEALEEVLKNNSKEGEQLIIGGILVGYKGSYVIYPRNPQLFKENPQDRISVTGDLIILNGNISIRSEKDNVVYKILESDKLEALRKTKSPETKRFVLSGYATRYKEENYLLVLSHSFFQKG